MTLLSIREQEAVQETVVMREMARWNSAIVFPHELAAYDRALILATRDAIARQVREKAKWMTAQESCEIVRATATFIEGLPL